MAKNRPLTCAIAAVITIVCGLAIRMAPMGLPQTLSKYGGSMLWAAMVYWILAACLSKLPPPRVALFACLVATAVELGKLIHTPALDAFRLTLAGKLLVGRYFSLADIAAYWIAIGLVCLADRGWVKPPV